MGKAISAFVNDCIPNAGGVTAVNVTSRSTMWGRQLSPFVLGPVPLYGGQQSLTVENAWQYSKVYPQFIDQRTGDPTPQYFTWARDGWSSQLAQRYPMGRGAKPAYSWWDGRKLGYVEARKAIYVPLYWNAARLTSAFQQLVRTVASHELTILLDFDNRDYKALGMTIDDALNDPSKPFGHSLVLLLMLRAIGLEIG